MSTRARNVLQPYVDEIKRLTGLLVFLDGSNGGYCLRVDDGTGRHYGPRGSVGEMKTFLEGTVNGCRMLYDGLRSYCDKKPEPFINHGGDRVTEIFKVEIAGLHADMLDSLIDGQEDDLGLALAPIRDYLRRIHVGEICATTR